jgi:hypothetical protein
MCLGYTVRTVCYYKGQGSVHEIIQARCCVGKVFGNAFFHFPFECERDDVLGEACATNFVDGLTNLKTDKVCVNRPLHTSVHATTSAWYSQVGRGGRQRPWATVRYDEHSQTNCLSSEGFH